MGLVWLALMLWYIFVTVTGVATKKERLCIAVLLDVASFGCCVSIFFKYGLHPFWTPWTLFFGYFNLRMAWKDYKRWRDADDDDDFRHKRKTKILNKIPKPTIVKLRPIETGA